MPINFAFVGPGRVGASLARRWSLAGMQCIGAVGRDEEKTLDALAFVGSGRPLAPFELGESAAVVLIALGASGLGPAELVAWLRVDELRGKVAVVAAIALATPFFVPAGILAILPGYVWGTAWGTGLAGLVAAIGGALNMMLARWAFRGFIGRMVSSNQGLVALRQVIAERGFRIALALRLSPVAPYSLLAYLAVLAGLRIGTFAVASILGGIPWTMVYAGFGALLASRDAALRLEAPPDTPATTTLRVLGLLFTVLVAWWIGRVAKGDLARLRAGQ